MEIVYIVYGRMNQMIDGPGVKYWLNGNRLECTWKNDGPILVLASYTGQAGLVWNVYGRMAKLRVLV